MHLSAEDQVGMLCSAANLESSAAWAHSSQCSCRRHQQSVLLLLSAAGQPPQQRIVGKALTQVNRGPVLVQSKAELLRHLLMKSHRLFRLSFATLPQ